MGTVYCRLFSHKSNKKLYDEVLTLLKNMFKEYIDYIICLTCFVKYSTLLFTSYICTEKWDVQ